MHPSPQPRMYFLALVVPPALNEKIRVFKEWMKERYGCTVALKSPAHITLVAPFWMDGQKEEMVKEALRQFSFTTGTGPVELDGFDHFGNRVIFIRVRPNPGLMQLQEAVANYFQVAFPGIVKKEKRAFHPHISIASRDLSPGDFLHAWDRFAGKSFHGVFEPEALSLLRLDNGKWVILGERRQDEGTEGNN